MNEPQRNLTYKFTGFEFLVGDLVKKKKSYPFPGKIVSAFNNIAGEARYVVECTAKAAAGCLHIFNGDQLERRKK